MDHCWGTFDQDYLGVKKSFLSSPHTETIAPANQFALPGSERSTPTYQRRESSEPTVSSYPAPTAVTPEFATRCSLLDVQTTMLDAPLQALMVSPQAPMVSPQAPMVSPVQYQRV